MERLVRDYRAVLDIPEGGEPELIERTAVGAVLQSFYHRPSDDKMLTGVEAALRRARQRALEIAARTGTPIVIYRDGKSEKRPVTQGENLK